jgi:DNA polymerase-3 subunit delta'
MPPRRTTKDAEAPEPDRLEGHTHPRENLRLVGHANVLARAAQAIQSSRPPQAWLITGPPGIGKATFAYRIARYLLAFGATENGPADLSVADRDPATIQVSAASHPGLLVLKRSPHPDTGRLMNVISVNEIRKLGGFFGMTSGAGGWRIAIVDTADDMNDNAANAILKLLEEPPARAMLLLLANTPGRLLPTIRSRCQRIDLKPLDASVVANELARLLPEAKPKERESLARLSGGSIGMALQLAGGDGIMLAEEADKLIESAKAPDVAALLVLGDKVARMTDGIGDFGGFLLQAMGDRIRARAHAGAPHLDRWLECLSKLVESFEQTTLLYLDPRQTILSASHAVSMTARRAGSI